jgi:hypothetical protein
VQAPADIDAANIPPILRRRKDEVRAQSGFLANPASCLCGSMFVDVGEGRFGDVPVARLVNNQAACKRLIDSLVIINPIKSSSPILIF